MIGLIVRNGKERISESKCEISVDKILFSLELLIIGDVLKTISDPSANELLTVGVIVVIRTVLGYFLSKEVEECHFD